jgi:hypothetical protein
VRPRLALLLLVLLAGCGGDDIEGRIDRARDDVQAQLEQARDEFRERR